VRITAPQITATQKVRSAGLGTDEDGGTDTGLPSLD
jgi:hypothetical protein